MSPTANTLSQCICDSTRNLEHDFSCLTSYQYKDKKYRWVKHSDGSEVSVSTAIFKCVSSGLTRSLQLKLDEDHCQTELASIFSTEAKITITEEGLNLGLLCPAIVGAIFFIFNPDTM